MRNKERLDTFVEVMHSLNTTSVVSVLTKVARLGPALSGAAVLAATCAALIVEQGQRVGQERSRLDWATGWRRQLSNLSSVLSAEKCSWQD